MKETAACSRSEGTSLAVSPSPGGLPLVLAVALTSAHAYDPTPGLMPKLAKLTFPGKRRVALEVGTGDIVESKGTLQFDRLIARPVRKRILY